MTGIMDLIGSGHAGHGFLALFGGAVGLVRWPDVYTRLHAAHAAAIVGAPVALLGVALAAPTWAIALKIIALGALVTALAPTAIQIIGAAAHNAGETARVGPPPDSGRGPQ
jgi:multicomponent Na+:H+ antiporter subunit G